MLYYKDFESDPSGNKTGCPVRENEKKTWYTYTR